MSAEGTWAIDATKGFVQTIKLQQRLNYLKSRDYDAHTLFSGVAPLAVDGIIGPLTEDTLRRFKALGQNPVGNPGLFDVELDATRLTA